MNIGFALITSSPFFDRIIEIENAFHDRAGFFDLLGNQKNLPHTTLFQGTMKEDIDFQKIAASAADEFCRLFPSGMIEFGSCKYVPEGWYFWKCIKTEAFQTLHDYVLHKVYPYIVLDPQRLARNNKVLSPVEKQAIERYGYRYAAEAFNPHITIGRSAQKNDELLFELDRALQELGNKASIAKLTVYGMGPNGTHQSTLFEVPII